MSTHTHYYGNGETGPDIHMSNHNHYHILPTGQMSLVTNDSEEHIHGVVGSNVFTGGVI